MWCMAPTFISLTAGVLTFPAWKQACKQVPALGAQLHMLRSKRGICSVLGLLLPAFCFICSLLCTSGSWLTVNNTKKYISYESSGEGESTQLRRSQWHQPWLSPHSSNWSSYSFRSLFKDSFTHLHITKLHRQVLVDISSPNLLRPYNHRVPTGSPQWLG